MKKKKLTLLTFIKNKLFSQLKKVCFLFFLIIFSNTIIAQSNTDWLEGSWGITFPVFGGSRMDSEVSRGLDPVAGAQEIVDELSEVGHVITNLSYFAHSHYFTLSQNNYVDVRKEIHPDVVPNAANDQIIFDVLETFKKADKKIILYISTQYFSRAAKDNPDIKTNWDKFVAKHDNQNEAYVKLLRGYVEVLKDYADGYWLDTVTANVEDIVDMIKEVDPTAIVTTNQGKSYIRVEDGTKAVVASNGESSTGETSSKVGYNIIKHVCDAAKYTQDFTNGHVTSIIKAPTDSWGYDEFTVGDMIEEPYTDYNGKQVIKHAWFPVRYRWHTPSGDLLYDTERSYRTVKSIIDAGATVTLANTVKYTTGRMMADEMVMMKEVNRRLLLNQDCEPYTRPEGARLEGEVFVPVTGVNITQNNISLDPGKTKTLNSTVSPSNASTSKVIIWSSSDTAVATVNSSGKVTAVDGGTATIRGRTLYEGYVDTCKVTVSGESGNEEEETEDAENIGPWNITELREVPNWKISNVEPKDGMTGILYESIDYLGKKVEVFAYYSAPDGTPPTGGWPAAIFAHGGGGTAYQQAVKYWNDKGYAAISMDLEGQYPNDEKTPNPGPKRVGVWNDYKLPIEEQWYYHAIAQVMKAHSLIASFPEVNADKIGLIGASWGGTITSTTMGVDNRLAWAIPVYGGGFLSESDGHQGDAITSTAEANFVNTYYDGSAYFDNVTFPTLWLNGLNDHHFSLSVNQKSSQAVNGPAYLLYVKGFAHGHLTWRNRDEVYRFADSVVNGGTALAQVGNPSINSNKASVTASSNIGISSAQLFYTNDGDTVDLNDKSWVSTNASISGNTISATIPANAEIIFFAVTDTQGYMVTSEYMSTSDTGGGDNDEDGDNEEEDGETTNSGGNIALNGNASQSSTNYEGEASRAIDGNSDGKYSNGSVTHTESGTVGAWWQVVLDTPTNISEIKLFNRTDACCTSRLSNFTVFISSGNGKWEYNKTFTSTPDPSMTIDVDGIFAKTIRIRSNTTDALSLAEVQVFGAVACPDFSTIDAEDFDNMSGVQVETSSDTGAGEQIGYINNGDWTMYSNIDLSCATSIQARVSSKTSGGNIEVRLDGVSGELIGTIPVTTTNSWTTYKTVSSAISSVSGTHNVYLVYTGGNGYLFNVNSIEFSNSQAKEISSINSNSNELIIYPNPVEDQFTISLGTTETTSYTISDTSGKTVLTGVINEGTSSIDISGLTSGFYLITVTDEEQTLTSKIVKQ